MPVIRECTEAQCYWCDKPAKWEVVLFAWEDPIHHPFCPKCWSCAKQILIWKSKE